MTYQRKLTWSQVLNITWRVRNNDFALPEELFNLLFRLSNTTYKLKETYFAIDFDQKAANKVFGEMVRMADLDKFYDLLATANMSIRERDWGVFDRLLKKMLNSSPSHDLCLEQCPYRWKKLLFLLEDYKEETRVPHKLLNKIREGKKNATAWRKRQKK
jgi:hypothetical protein